MRNRDKIIVRFVGISPPEKSGKYNDPYGKDIENKKVVERAYGYS